MSGTHQALQRQSQGVTTAEREGSRVMQHRPTRQGIMTLTRKKKNSVYWRVYGEATEKPPQSKANTSLSHHHQSNCRGHLLYGKDETRSY
ncbi:hypothetical protein E2C01_010629 [Portunus trituberculatus]|uniref:Uncharacterized protein n=1 Tax=Portunus trituberculatus TaxID=210409 RepID=A0A5B7D9D1_PORTR|nr:hypothetical protein [Portunus trituberculatus]